MERIFFYIILIPGILMIISCDEETLTSTASQRYFSLYFDVKRDFQTNEMYIDVNFWTSGFSEVPTVIINGVSMEDFGFSQGLYGRIFNLQYSDTVNYSISLSGKTTSGSLEMPSDPYTVLCNGNPVVKGHNYFPLPQNNSFNISWLCNSYDYFYIYWNSIDNYGNDNITNNDYTFYFDGTGSYYFGIFAHKGPILESGSKPNVTGDYGKGYVFAESDGFTFDWYYSSSKIQNLPANVEDDEARIKYYGDKFYEIISGE